VPQESNPSHDTSLGPTMAATGLARDMEETEVSDALKSRAARGSVWTLVGFGCSQGFRLLNNLILWRLLYPEAFGIMSLVYVCLTGLAMFSDIGIGPSIVQNERGDDPSYLNTAWTIQVIRELLLCLGALMLARPMAVFYKEPQLFTLLPAAALISFISGFNSTRLFTATRRLALGRLTLIDLSSQVLGLGIMIGWAWHFRSIWAVIVGSLTSNVLKLILSHTFLPGERNRFHWDPTSARTLLRFGRWIFFSTLLTFAVMQSDRLIFGKLIPMAMLGVYNIGATWAGLPLSIAYRVFSAVLFPLLSQLRQKGLNFSAAFLEARRPWLLLGGWASAGLIGGGPVLVRLLYTPPAASAGWIIQVLTIGIWFFLLESANSIAFLALGESKWVAAGNAAKLVGMVVLIPLGYAHFGFPGAVVGFSGSELFRYATSVLGVRRHKIACLGEDLRLTALVLATAGVGLLVARWSGPLLQSIAIRPAKLGAFLEGLLIAIAVSVGWTWVYLLGISRRKKTQKSCLGR
jgi:O-antigen/teichoic acid export membrane protein